VFTNGSVNNQFEHELSLIEAILSKLTSSSAGLHPYMQTSDHLVDASIKTIKYLNG
jgi:hypothetical protein